MWRTLVALMLAVGGLTPGLTFADPNYDAHASDFRSLTATIPAGATSTFTCDVPPDEAYAAFLWTSVDFHNGGYARGWTVYRDASERSVYVRVEAAGMEERVDLTAGEPSTRSLPIGGSSTNESGAPAAFRAAWAIWGEASDCRLLIDGVEAGSEVSHPGADATRATAEDFTKFAYVSTGSTGGWMVNARHDESFSGHLVYMFDGLSATGPDGLRRDTYGNEQTSGTWSFRSTYGQVHERSGMLYALVLPLDEEAEALAKGRAALRPSPLDSAP